jgi:dihydropteroate synthase
MVDTGAGIIDVGAESARADRPKVPADRQSDLVVPVIRRLSSASRAVISVDTYHESVAEAALDAGAHIVNDISGMLAGEGAARAAARAGAAYVLNHSYEVPKVRPRWAPFYADVVAETYDFLAAGAKRLEEMGLSRQSILVDPGIAFGKSHDEDLQVLRRLAEFRSLGHPVVLAASRKNVIGSVLGAPPGERLAGDAAISALAVAAGVSVLRVHDVATIRKVVDMAAAVIHGAAGDYAPASDSWPWAEQAGAVAHAASAAGPGAAPPEGQRW